MMHDTQGDWEVLPANWHNSHNFTDAGPSPMSGWKNPYSKDPGTCTWETGRKTNSTAEDGCDAKQHGVMRRFQQEFSAAMAPVLEPSSPHGCFVDNWAPESGGRTWVLRVRDWPSQNGVLGYD